MDITSYKDRCSHINGCTYHGLCLLDPSNSYGVACKCFEGWYGRKCFQNENVQYPEQNIKSLLVFGILIVLALFCLLCMIMKLRQIYAKKSSVRDMRIRVEEGLPYPVSYRQVDEN